MKDHREAQAGCLRLNYVLSVLSGKYRISILYLMANHNGTVRFNELRRSIGGIPCKTLSSTLKRMEEDDLLSRVEFPQVPPRVEYSLTNRGWSLLPVLNAIDSWGIEHPQ